MLYGRNNEHYQTKIHESPQLCISLSIAIDMYQGSVDKRLPRVIKARCDSSLVLLRCSDLQCYSGHQSMYKVAPWSVIKLRQATSGLISWLLYNQSSKCRQQPGSLIVLGLDAEHVLLTQSHDGVSDLCCSQEYPQPNAKSLHLSKQWDFVSNTENSDDNSLRTVLAVSTKCKSYRLKHISKIASFLQKSMPS